MGGVLVIAAFVALAAGAAYVSLYLKRKRRQQLAMVATQLGMQYSAEDTRGCLGFPFALLRMGDGRGTENVLWGTWQDLAVTEFDYWYYDESTDSKGHRTRSYSHFSCVVAQVDAECPHLTLDREHVLTWIADHIGLRDIEFESDEFNRRFNVKCADRKFANDIIDARMMQWLLGVDDAFRFEVSGTSLLCYARRRAPADLVPLFGTAKQFLDHVPKVVYDLYGAGTAR